MYIGSWKVNTLLKSKVPVLKQMVNTLFIGVSILSIYKKGGSKRIQGVGKVNLS